MAARGSNARKKEKRRRHAKTRKAQREAAAQVIQERPQGRRAAAEKPAGR
jgi:hypothetical protein